MSGGIGILLGLCLEGRHRLLSVHLLPSTRVPNGMCAASQMKLGHRLREGGCYEKLGSTIWLRHHYFPTCSRAGGSPMVGAQSTKLS